MGKKDKRWVLQRKNDHYYNLAKKRNYRSRATYKLFQLNEKFNIIKEKNVVVDLGCAPRITSYNVCYTKLLRSIIEIGRPNNDICGVRVEKCMFGITTIGGTNPFANIRKNNIPVEMKTLHRSIDYSELKHYEDI